MEDSVCLSDTCRVCGAGGQTSNIASVPDRGRIRVERQYNCGRRLRFFYEIADVQIETDCGTVGKRTRPHT